MELSTNVPSWDEISAVLKSKMKYAAASLERARQTYKVFIKSCCSNCQGGDNGSVIKEGIKKAGILYEDGKISKSKLTRIRTLAFRMLQYSQTGTITWKRVPPYGQRYANDEHEQLISMFVQREQQARSHAESIISRDRCIIRIFLIYAEDHGFSHKTVTAFEMIGFLKYMRGRRPAGIKSIVSALRHFYLCLIGMVPMIEYYVFGNVSILGGDKKSERLNDLQENPYTIVHLCHMHRAQFHHILPSTALSQKKDYKLLTSLSTCLSRLLNRLPIILIYPPQSTKSASYTRRSVIYLYNDSQKKP